MRSGRPLPGSPRGAGRAPGGGSSSWASERLGPSWRGGLGAWDRKADKPEHVNAFWCSPPLILSRGTFTDVGGMDERYRGWGGEDTAFGRALWKSGHGFPSNGSEDCVHLWHPRLGEYGEDRWAGQETVLPNEHLDREYNRAHTRDDIRALIARR